MISRISSTIVCTLLLCPGYQLYCMWSAVSGAQLTLVASACVCSRLVIAVKSLAACSSGDIFCLYISSIGDLMLVVDIR